MNSIGLCQHNNVETYCPTCIRSKAANMRSAMSGGMGATVCQPGFYELSVFGQGTGVCVPTGGTLATGVQTGVTSTVATGAAGSPAVSTASRSAAAGTVTGFLAKYPYQIAAGVGLLVVLGIMGAGGLVGRRS